MRSLSRRRLLSFASLSPVALVARASAAGQDPVDPPPQTCPAVPIMATAGVAAGQGLRVSLFHHPEVQIPDSPCAFKIEVVGLGGELLDMHEGEVFPGQGAFANFNIAKGLKPPQRVQAHVNVTVPEGHEAMIGATAEVVDLLTGETRIPASPCAEPAPFGLAMGTVGIVRTEVVRVSLFHHLDPAGAVNPCLYRLALTGIDGKVLASDTGQVLPGQGAAFDYDLAKAAGLRLRERLQFHGDVWVEHPAEVGSLIEIVDRQSGGTGSSVTPCLLPL